MFVGSFDELAALERGAGRTSATRCGAFIREAQEKRVAQVVAESGEEHPAVTRATAAGDTRKLRGIPAHARGVNGAIAGTQPGDGLE